MLLSEVIGLFLIALLVSVFLAKRYRVRDPELEAELDRAHIEALPEIRRAEELARQEEELARQEAKRVKAGRPGFFSRLVGNIVELLIFFLIVGLFLAVVKVALWGFGL